MNKITSLPFLVLIVGLLIFSCNGPSVKENIASTTVKASKKLGDKYFIDVKESRLTWKCSMQLGAGGHTGYVYVSKGELVMEKNQLSGGSVEINMNTIEDEKHGSKNNLVDHLKSPDFFEVEKFPTSAFVITTVVPANDTLMITGILTIKGIMQTVSFPAKIDVKKGVVNASGKLTIDRTRWDVRYNSGKFFENLADKAISDNIEFEVKLVAKRGC